MAVPPVAVSLNIRASGSALRFESAMSTVPVMMSPAFAYFTASAVIPVVVICILPTAGLIRSIPVITDERANTTLPAPSRARKQANFPL